MDDVEAGQIIFRHVTNAKRVVLARLVIGNTDYIVSQYLSSSKPRIDSIPYLHSQEYQVYNGTLTPRDKKNLKKKMPYLDL